MLQPNIKLIYEKLTYIFQLCECEHCQPNGRRTALVKSLKKSTLYPHAIMGRAPHNLN